MFSNPISRPLSYYVVIVYDITVLAIKAKYLDFRNLNSLVTTYVVYGPPMSVGEFPSDKKAFETATFSFSWLGT